MKRHRLTTLFFIMIFAIAGCLFGSTAFAEPEKPAAAIEESEPPRFVAYYFYTDYRCASCKRIEAWSEQAIQSQFADALKSGKMAWQPVNTDKSENAHFVDDFNLYTKSLVIVEQEDGKAVRWKNLQRVWHLLGDQDKFTGYVTQEIKAFMENS